MNDIKIQTAHNTNLAWAIGIASVIIIFLVIVLANKGTRPYDAAPNYNQNAGATNTPAPNNNAPIPSSGIEQQQKTNVITTGAQTEAEKKQIAQVLDKHPDALDLSRKGEVVKWIEMQPAQEKAWYNWALDHGGAQDVIKVFDDFKLATGRVTTAAPAAPAALPYETRRLRNDSNLSANKEFIKIMNKKPPPQTVKKPIEFSELSPSQQQSLELSCFEARAKGQLQFDGCIKAKLSNYK